MQSVTVELDIPVFRAQFPAYEDVLVYPDERVELYWTQATCYVSDINYGALSDTCRQLALNFMTAHLLWLSDRVEAGSSTPGLKQSGVIDKVQVTLTPPSLKSQWQWWLSLSTYGQQLFALLQTRSVGGLYVGGLPERLAFRKVYGTFGV